MIDFTKIDYLSTGNSKQRRLFDLIRKYRIFESIQEFDPVLAGTIPINIDIDSSDADILCFCENEMYFSKSLEVSFGKYPRFEIHEKEINRHKTIISRFEIDGLCFEIFGQNIQPTKQRAYLHMLTEYRILAEKGDDFRNNVIQLKKAGIKTEPAFAQLLGIAGDPYLGLLEYPLCSIKSL